MALVGFVGIGNMGFAMLKGASNVFLKEELIYTDVNESRLAQVKDETGIEFSLDITNLVENTKYVVLAIKPQYYNVVLEQIKPLLCDKHIVISIAPGITIANLKEQLGENVKIVRAMPNTPAMVNEGMSGICFSNDLFSESEREEVGKFFGSFGKYEIIEEHLMNAVVCANGSSPAYVYVFIEALADSVVKYGIPRDKAYTLVAQTVLGAAKMVLETKEHPGKLKDQVCSPGGTTIAGIAALEEQGFRNAIIKATDACIAKAESFQKK